MPPEQQQRQREHEPAPWQPKEQMPFDGPRMPNVEKPDTSNIIKKLRSVDRESSRKYRQRSGQPEIVELIELFLYSPDIRVGG